MQAVCVKLIPFPTRETAALVCVVLGADAGCQCVVTAVFISFALRMINAVYIVVMVAGLAGL